MSKQDFMSDMTSKYGKMSKSQRIIASYISDHYDQAVFMTAAELGKTLRISESTVVRFAMMLGYEGYPEFQDALEEWVKNQLTDMQKSGIRFANSTQSEVLQSVLQSDMEKIHDTLVHMDPSAFDTAIDIILRAKRVYISGIRSCEPLAEFLSFYLSMVRSDVFCLKTTSMSETFEQMIRIGEKDAFIGISFPRYSMRTLKAMEFANDRNAKIISITDTIHSPMCMYSSCNLLARSDMVSIVDSLVAPLSVINALVVGLCMRRPAEVKNSLHTLEEVWNNYQVYLNDEINFINDETVLNYPLRKEDNKS
ncbi:MAG: MurR/RpiR family transcriptional regulator [Lachnospiraceae bacterium]|jgi:DNA-binding MurR/RpiR family transcriptional regulator|nr:MurR/RpiR family transcriptional regulator [Lachnospiraceae bacterium]